MGINPSRSVLFDTFRLLHFANRFKTDIITISSCKIYYWEGSAMPYIATQVSTPLTPEKEKVLKERFGQAIELLGKTESWLMLSFAAYGSKGTRSNPAPLYALNYLERPHRQHTKK
jgi:hypothetical protein